MEEKKKLEIEKQAREILEKFGKSIGKVKLKGKKAKKGLSGFRKEGQGKKCDSEFREIMFKNAPKKEGDFIVAETKSW